MLSSRKVAFSSFVLLGVLLGGCQFLKKSGDSSGDASAEAAAPAPSETAAAPAADDAGATATATAPTVVTRIVPRTDGGAGDAGASAVMADGGAVQECCCEATGFPLQSVAMSDCNKTRKGQCVKKERCEAAVVVDAGAAPVAPAAPGTTPPAIEPQTCCCDVPNGTKVVISQKECATTKKGQCVALANCGLKFRRPGQK
jgi:hypothetical protein